MKVVDTKAFKTIQSANFNSVFCKKTGEFFRWGATKNDDPDFCPFGNEILDIEISTICYGPQKENNKCSPCLACYKNLTSKGENMSLETYKTILDRVCNSKIKIILNDNNVKTFFLNEKVLLTNGSYKLAKNLTEDDDIKI